MSGPADVSSRLWRLPSGYRGLTLQHYFRTHPSTISSISLSDFLADRAVLRGFEPETSVKGGLLDVEDDVEALRRGRVVAPVVEKLPEAEVLDGLELQRIVQLVRHRDQNSGLKMTLP